jgi:hypothetical protein
MSVVKFTISDRRPGHSCMRRDGVSQWHQFDLVDHRFAEKEHAEIKGRQGDKGRGVETTNQAEDDFF